MRAPTYTIRPTSVGILARGRDYSVKDLGATQAGYTNLLDKELGVSLAADRGTTRYTQLHELAHVRHSKWSPERICKTVKRKLKRDLPCELVLAAEDARINELLIRAVPDAHTGYKNEGESFRFDLAGYVASHATPEPVRKAIRKALNPASVAKVDARLTALGKLSTHELESVWGVTVPLALWMLDELTSAPKRDESDESDESDSDEGGSGSGTAGDEPAPATEDGDEPEPSDDGDDSGADTSDDESESDGAPADSKASEDGDESSDDAAGDDSGEGAEEDADADDEAMLGKPDAGGDAGAVCARPSAGADGGRRHVPWVIPEVLEPALTVPIASRLGNTAVRSSDTGSALRWSGLHRMQTDGVVFRKTRHRPGALQRGTLLIDMSGSMSLSNETVEMLIDKLPYATVAGYRGSPSAGKAWIIVLARGGRRVADLNDAAIPYGHGNMCDGPALLWLSRQQRPLLWVCDGSVTGEGDGYSSQLVAECAAIMQAAGIVQVTGKRYGSGELQAYSCHVERGCPTLTEKNVREMLRTIESGRTESGRTE